MAAQNNPQPNGDEHSCLPLADAPVLATWADPGGGRQLPCAIALALQLPNIKLEVSAVREPIL